MGTEGSLQFSQQIVSVAYCKPDVLILFRRTEQDAFDRDSLLLQQNCLCAPLRRHCGLD